MYTPKYYRLENEDNVFQVIEENSFATVVSYKDGVPTATHIPLLVHREENYLSGHFARANKQWRELDGQEVLAIFHGPHSYISPSWYETTDAVPTWNYVAVHVYGKVEIVEDAEEVKALLSKMVDKYEGVDSSYKLENVSASYLDGLYNGLVCFKLPISRVEATAKLSQNHSVERQGRVVNELQKVGTDQAKDVAKWMKG
ncbi:MULTISPECIES: FMN-binding negative transcriptional regulator [Bacillus]|uniref:FMN-binding negative transcriptional regulator n=1 Tax=Bacillus TaxID=1386 RepID=UPI000BB86210|nr:MULTISPECIES: FMN-binding negative transcriptional regulator [Bacillus]